ncbi:unnamed protein product [Protopolystoma xenopodis]|uniref:Uncharacterized protein n=1 Tax=Protopolystoma xenopodis TaxID=117903 RepID=A0A3S4ZXT4_9PLAT|nr:unnamed protein product [Protopolystoma xenopodis]
MAINQIASIVTLPMLDAFKCLSAGLDRLAVDLKAELDWLENEEKTAGSSDKTPYHSSPECGITDSGAVTDLITFS